MNQEDRLSQDIAKAGMGKIVRSGFSLSKKILSPFIKALVAPLIPMFIVLIKILLLFFLIYTILFLFPKFMIDEKTQGAEGQIIPIYSVGLGDKDTWQEIHDQELVERYKHLMKNSYTDGLQGKEDLRDRIDSYFSSYINAGTIPSQQDMAYNHRLPWSILAGVDRVVGDPIIHKGKERKPQPEKHYDTLKPAFNWTTFDAVGVERIIEVDENGHETISYIPHTATVPLLKTAHTFEVTTYKYEWVEEREYYNDGHLKSVMPKLVTIEKNGPFFEPLKTLMSQYNITDLLEIETVLELAELYDEEYSVDAGILGARVEGFHVDTTKQFYTGEMGTICLPILSEYFKITSPFGMRDHPKLKIRKMHTGIDIGAPSGVPVYSAWNGKVIWSGNKGGYGKCVMVDHGDIITLYGHLSLITTSRGKEVKSGDNIGLVGSTGVSTGPHLHFEIMKKIGGGTRYEDPQKYF